MERQSVVSSNIESIGYDKENEVMQVEFKYGAIYNYFDVPEKTFKDLINAESVGNAFSKIKYRYRYEKEEILNTE